MTAYRFVALRCDGDTGDGFRTCAWVLEGDTATDLRREARSKGWLVSRPGGKDFCPRHKHQILDRRGRDRLHATQDQG